MAPHGAPLAPKFSCPELAASPVPHRDDHRAGHLFINKTASQRNCRHESEAVTLRLQPWARAIVDCGGTAAPAGLGDVVIASNAGLQIMRCTLAAGQPRALSPQEEPPCTADFNIVDSFVERCDVRPPN